MTYFNDWSERAAAVDQQTTRYLGDLLTSLSTTSLEVIHTHTHTHTHIYMRYIMLIIWCVCIYIYISLVLIRIIFLYILGSYMLPSSDYAQWSVKNFS